MDCIYITYEIYKSKYLQAQRQCDEILREKEYLFSRTQPRAAKTDKGIVSKGGTTNNFDDYLVAKEQQRIDERLAEIKSIMDDRKRLLQLKEAELRRSKNHFDKIYRMRYLDRASIHKIAMSLNYSVSQIYRILETCEKMRKNATY